MEFVKTFFFRLDPTSIVIGAIVGALISAWLEFFIKQPKLIRNGSGSGGVPGQLKQNSLSFQNAVGWLGVTLRESRIFGFRVHPTFRKGLTFERSPARDCRATLHLKATGESIGQLWWNAFDGAVKDKITIDSGGQASLLIFCRKDDEENYFVYQPTSPDNAAPKIPDVRAHFTGGQEFILRVHYSHGRMYEEIITIYQTFNGLLYLKTNNGSSIF